MVATPALDDYAAIRLWADSYAGQVEGLAFLEGLSWLRGCSVGLSLGVTLLALTFVFLQLYRPKYAEIVPMLPPPTINTLFMVIVSLLLVLYLKVTCTRPTQLY